MVDNSEIHSAARQAAREAVDPSLRQIHYRDAASYLLRRAEGEDGLGEHATAEGYKAAAEALRTEAERMVTTERQGADSIREADDAD